MESITPSSEVVTDLIIELADGSAIGVNKTILCEKNEYFNSMCGPKSQFALQESHQSSVTLQDDEVLGVIALLRGINGLQPLEAHQESLENWLIVREVANKYLDLMLSQFAFDRFWDVCLYVRTPEEVFTIIQLVDTYMINDNKVMQATSYLRKSWLHQLLKLPEFRAYLDHDTMLELLEDLSGHIDATSAPTDLQGSHVSTIRLHFGEETEQTVEVCDMHRKTVLQELAHKLRSSGPGCFVCNDDDEMGMGGTNRDLQISQVHVSLMANE